MANLLRLTKDQYFQGAARVFLGDSWLINCLAVNCIGGVDTPVDLTGCPAPTAYFPGTGADVPVATVVLDAKAGKFQVQCSPSAQAPIVSAPTGCQLYAVIDGIPATGNPQTYQMPEAELEILLRTTLQPT